MLRTRTDGIVVHRAEVYSLTDYHYIVMRDGSIKPLCPIAEKGEHAIAYNASTVGVAVFGCFAKLEPGRNSIPTDVQLASTISLLQYINALYGMKLWVAGHSELGPLGTSVPLKLTYGHTCPGENFNLNDLVKKSGLMRWTPSIVSSAK